MRLRPVLWASDTPPFPSRASPGPLGGVRSCSSRPPVAPGCSVSLVSGHHPVPACTDCLVPAPVPSLSPASPVPWRS